MIIKEMKIQSTEWEKIFINHISYKSLLSRIYKRMIIASRIYVVKWRGNQHNLYEEAVFIT